MSSQIAEFFASIKADTSGFDKGVKNVKGNLEGLKGGFKDFGLSGVASFLSISGAVTGAVAAFKSASDATIKYAGEVRDLQAASGATAEEASKLLQVLDDYELSAQDVTAATRFLTKNGLTPTIDTLAKLSDQYLSLNTAQERNAFVMENLGRGGLQWVNVLKQGGDALREQAGEVNKNLILTQKQVDQTERYRLAIDNAKDSIEGFKVATVSAFLNMSDASKTYSQAVQNVADKEGKTYDQVNNAHVKYAKAIGEEVAQIQHAAAVGDYYNRMLASQKTVTEEATMSTDELNAQMDLLAGYMSSDLTDAQKDYNDKIAEYTQQLGEAKTAEEKMGIQEKIDAETEAYRRRAKEIVFNIQQEQILNSDLGATQKAEAISTLANSYGLIDENEKRVIDTTAELVKRYQEGTISEEAFTQGLRNQAFYAQSAGNNTKLLADKTFNLANQTKKVMSPLQEYRDLQQEIGQEIRSNSLPASAELVTNLQRVPASFARTYTFNIITKGKVPSIPTNMSGEVGGMCFAAGTRVTLADGTHKPIEDVEIGEDVRAYDLATGEFVSAKVARRFRHEADVYINIDGLHVTPEHPIWNVTRNEWMKAGELEFGDTIFLDNNTNKVIQHIYKQALAQTETVYNLEVEGVHTYFAGGVLVHNKTTDTGEGGISHWRGGWMGKGWNILGDAPGGGWTAYTEAIAPNGKIFDAKETRILKAAGVLNGATHNWTTDTSQSNTQTTTGNGGNAGGGTNPGGGGGGGSAGGGTSHSTTPSSGGGGGTTTTSSSSTTTPASSAVVASFLHQSSAAEGATVSLARAIDSRTVSQIRTQSETNRLLGVLITKTPSALQQAKANKELASKYS